MKKVEAIIRPNKLDQVNTALIKAGVVGITVSRVRGFGREKGPTLLRKYAFKFEVMFMQRAKLEIVVNDNHVDLVVETIMKTARTGEVGDGKIFITPVEEVVRIQTGEKNLAAMELPQLGACK